MFYTSHTKQKWEKYDHSWVKSGGGSGGNLAALAGLAGKGNAGGGGSGNLAALAALAGKGGLGLVTKTNSLNLAFKATQVRYFCVLKYLT